MYDPLADERGASLRFDRPARAVPLFGHRQLLAQALSNLLENAIRYGSAGGEIDVRVQPGDKRAPASRSPIADRAFRSTAARKRCGASAGSIRAAPTRAPGSASRSPNRSPTCTRASFSSRTTGPGLLTALDLPVHRPGAR